MDQIRNLLGIILATIAKKVIETDYHIIIMLLAVAALVNV